MRAAAARIVFEVAYRGASLDAALAGRREPFDESDGALFRELCYGALRWFWRCHGILGELVDRPLRKRDRIVEALMIVGLYQLDQMRLPAHAAIHTTVECCERLERAGFKGLVNGVLRNFQRRRNDLLTILPEHALEAHPDWLWRTIREQWQDRAAGIIEADNSRPPMTLRVNVRRLSPADYLEALRARGLEARSVEGVPAALVLTHPVNVERLPGFAEGWVSVQDTCAQLLPGLIPRLTGRRVLDACAAPGGKLTQMLEVFPDLEVQAIDLDPGRAAMIRDNLRRLGLSAKVKVADAAEPAAWWDGRPFDLVVLDVPCSGTGVIRRHPDIKVLRRPSDIGRFAETQKRLMERLWQTVKPGGRMIYATCSILAQENQQQIEEFARCAPDCRPERIELPVGVALEKGWQTLPEPGGGDGLYYAALVKRDRPED